MRTLALLLTLLCLASCATKKTDGTELDRFEFTRDEMGMPFNIVLFAKTRSEGEAAATAAFDRIHQLNGIMSDYDADSELSLLSRTSGSGRPVPVSPDLWRVLEFSLAQSERTAGAFDVTVGPVVNLWRKARRDKQLPDETRLAEARQRVGYDKVQMNSKNGTVQLQLPEMRLDLGAVAKGYALGEAMKVLRSLKITRALVSGGGDMVAGDAPPRRKGWRVELPPLDAPNAPASRFVLIKNCALATSGDLFQRLEIDGKRYSHIVDPRTGIGLTDHSMVVVIAPTGALA
ncbi:MAG: FAD:protein FMN transferase, partial [Opitutaceae bacterium]|nr:FAD:protein FMN transferase [Verrucomicrobiales bacterium]